MIIEQTGERDSPVSAGNEKQKKQQNPSDTEGILPSPDPYGNRIEN